MNAATCGVLATVLPVVMLTAVLERRAIAIKIRRKDWFRRILLWTFGAAAIGLPISIIGVQSNGLDAGLGTVLWILAGVAVLGLGTTLLASMASTEVIEDEATSEA